MGYCFMTIQKVSSTRKMDSMFRHNYRKEIVLNADGNLSYLNDELVSLNGETYKSAYEGHIAKFDYGEGGKSVREKEIKALDIVLTFSREDAENVDIDKWKADNVSWLKKEFNVPGQAENVLSVVYHGDEAGNVHCHAFVVPIDPDGKLNATMFIGNRQKLIQLQDSYAKAMKHHGLQRGLKGTVASHTTIKKYYAALNAAAEKELPVPKIKENIIEYKKRCDKEYQKIMFKNLGLQLELKRSRQENIVRGKEELKQEKLDFYKERDKFYKEKDGEH